MTRFSAIIGGVIATVAACFALWFQGRKAGQIAQGAKSIIAKGKADADKVHGLEAAHDDQGVQDALQDAADKAKHVTGLIVILGLLALSWGPILGQEAPNCHARPAFCPAGWICIPTHCAAEDAAELFLLTSQVEALKLKARKGHFHLMGVTCGPAASLSVDSGQTTLAGTVSCAVGLTIAP